MSVIFTFNANKVTFIHFLFEWRIAYSLYRKTIWTHVKFSNGSVLKTNPNGISVFNTSLTISSGGYKRAAELEMGQVPLSSPCPRRPNRPMTMRHGVVVWLITPTRKSQSFCRADRRTAITLRWLRNGTSMLMHVVSSSSPRESVQDANNQRWSALRQYVHRRTPERSTGSSSDAQMLRGGASTNGEL